MDCINSEDDNDSSTKSGRSSTNSYGKFAPAQDSSLTAARHSQQRTPSPSSTLLPSRISAQSRRLQTFSANNNNTGRANSPPTSSRANSTHIVAPTASVTMSASPQKRSIVGKPGLTRPRSGTQGSSSPSSLQKDTKELRKAQLEKLKIQHQQLKQQQKPSSYIDDENDDDERNNKYENKQQQQQYEDEDDDDDNYENREKDDDVFMDQEQEEEKETTNDYTASYSNTIQEKPSMINDPQSPSDISNMNTTTKNNRIYGALDTSAPISKSDQMISMKDYEELRLKLKILEAKRQEDRERYREHEKIKEEAEQFLTLRNKLQDKVTELQKDLREATRRSKENETEKENMEMKYTDALESLEMMTLDKEVAEERAENLQQEVSLLKDKLEEVSVDLDILRKDADILNRPPEANGDERTPLEIVQLERHNERLKEALLRLRDATAEHEAELNRKIKDLERDNHELTEIKGQFERAKEKLDVAERQNENLKQRLDDALGAEDLVEQLAEKNLNLTEKLEEMRDAIDDLEALKELADELEENHLETEKQLQAEIDHRDMLLREQMERLAANEETSADYEATIQQFRELVLHLQSDLEQLKQKQESQQTEKQDLSSQSQAMMSLNIQLQSTVMKAQAKAIDLELRKLDAMQATDKLSYIQPYLPDSFVKTENDAISCLLLFKRLVFKSELIIKHLDQKYPISEKIMDTIPENLIAVCELRQRTGWLGDVATRFVTFIKHCKPDIFIKMGQVYHDLVGTERRLNGIVELLRTDELNESDSIVELQRMIAQLEHLTEVYIVPNGPPNHVDQFFGLTRALDFNADKLAVEFTFVKQTVENAARKDNIQITEGFERLDYDYLEPLTRLVVQAKNSKILARKLLRQLEDLSEQALTPKAEHLHRFKTLYAISSKVSRFCFETYKQIISYVDAKRGSKEEISLGIIQQIVYNKSDEILEIAESSMWEGALKTLKSLINELSNTFSRVESDNKMDKISTSTAPWIQRASDMKAEMIIDHDKDRKLQQHADEILKLIKDIKMKDLSLQEASVKVELLEKRMETVKKQADQIAILEESLQKTQTQEQMYAEAMENLQAEYDGLEQENAKLKKLISKKEEERSITTSTTLPKKSDLDGSDNNNATLDSNTNSNLLTLTTEIDSLKSVIRYLRAENKHLKSCDLARTIKLDQLPNIVHKHETPQQQSTTTTNDDDNETEEEKKDTENELDSSKNEIYRSNGNPIRDQVRSFATEARILIRDVRMVGATPKLVNLSEVHRGGKWQRHKYTPDYQYQTQQSAMYTLKQRTETLQSKLEQLQLTNKQNDSILTKEEKGTISNILNKSLAKIQIPRWNQLTSQRHCVQLQSLQEFDRIHSIFVR
ncbi:unnamed protein product [Cunninghamella echinulata]